jgi:hypothetical protein
MPVVFVVENIFYPMNKAKGIACEKNIGFKFFGEVLPHES